MAKLNWRDIQDKATTFSHEWKGAKDEDKEAKAFWVRFFDVFGVRERSLGLFEKRVQLAGLKAGKDGKIDFFAPNRFLVEHKSKGKNLDAAFEQAAGYFDALSEEEKPRYIIVSDFERFRIYDLEALEKEREFEFSLKDLPKHVTRFAFLVDEKVQEYKEEEHINVKAVKAIGKLHDAIRSTNYPPASLSSLLTRLVFCFFADDTGIFNKNVLRRYLEEKTDADGSDIGAHLTAIFEILDMPEDKRPNTIDDALASLPYVNGGLFAAPLPTVFASRAIRDTLINCSQFDWSNISPAIFGSMFQSVLDEKERHDLGAHYTSEENILKVINGLFLDNLKEELEAAKTNHEKLNALWGRLAIITLLDPACGCGNFLVIAYRELRRIELEIIKRIYKHEVKHVESGNAHLPIDVDIAKLSKLSVERMYGIEIEAFPAEVAKLSLWLMDHMMNVEIGTYFGKPFRKLPLREQPHIVQGNALRVDWESVVLKEKLTYILGNPPFIGSRIMNKEQKDDMAHVFGKIKGLGELDYVTAWYMKASDYIQGTNIDVAFVSTNSITQGEQVGILWPVLLRYGIKIRFAHRTFKWSNEASGKAAVYCVIIGFGLTEPKEKNIFEYDDISGEPIGKKVRNVNPYLVDATNIFIVARRKPISANIPQAVFGSMPNDAGQFLFESEEEKDAFIAKEPKASKFIRPLISGKEYLQGGQRFCLWLKNVSPEDIRALPEVIRRIENVRLHREMSSREATKKLAETPYLFGEDRQPNTDYILIPLTSSENRDYIPLSFFSSDKVANNTCALVPGATLYHIGILQSEMHMTWMRAVSGRLESRYRYSNELVYNNFPWPEKPTTEQKCDVEKTVQVILDVRKKYPDSTLADLYDPNTMPVDLLKAHHSLDKAVDASYGKKTFKSEPERLEFLFQEYQRLVK